MAKKNAICDHDCFNCKFDDCIADDMTPEEWAESQRRDRDTNLTPEQKKQRANREANREKIADQHRAYYEARRWAGLTQAAVAEALGISQPAYSNWETGAAPSDYGTVMGTIARLANCSLELLEERPLLV